MYEAYMNIEIYCKSLKCSLHRKGTIKPTPKIEKNVFTENICSARSTMQVVAFCKHVLIL